MSKLILLLAVTLLLCSCTVATVSEPSSAKSPQQSTEEVPSSTKKNESAWWLELKDLSGEIIDFHGNDVTGIGVEYAIGWNFDNNGHRKIRKGDIVGGCEVVELKSYYAVNNGIGWCEQNQIAVQKTAEMTGIIEVDQHNITFYPYPNSNDDNFVFLGERTPNWEDRYLDASQIIINSNKTVTVQPIPIFIANPDKNGVITEISEFLTDKPTDSLDYLLSFSEPVYLEAVLQFSSITFRARNMGDGLEDTIGNGNIGWLTEADRFGSIVVLSKL